MQHRCWNHDRLSPFKRTDGCTDRDAEPSCSESGQCVRITLADTPGIHEQALGNEEGMLPCVAKDGTKIMSVNLLLED